MEQNENMIITQDTDPVPHEWIYIDQYNSLPAADFLHCDTRDFHIICVMHESEPHIELNKLIARTKNLDIYKFNRSEILGTLKTLEMGTGGPGTWRHLIPTSARLSRINWLKYIRFIKLQETVDLVCGPEPVYVAYWTMNDKYVLLTRAELDPEKFDHKYLNHIESY